MQLGVPDPPATSIAIPEPGRLFATLAFRVKKPKMDLMAREGCAGNCATSDEVKWMVRRPSRRDEGARGRPGGKREKIWLSSDPLVLLLLASTERSTKDLP